MFWTIVEAFFFVTFGLPLILLAVVIGGGIVELIVEIVSSAINEFVSLSRYWDKIKRWLRELI